MKDKLHKVKTLTSYFVSNRRKIKLFTGFIWCMENIEKNVDGNFTKVENICYALMYNKNFLKY